MTDNAILAAILSLVEKIEKNTRNGYDVISGNEYVCDSAHPFIRSPFPTAVKTVVVNLGPQPLRIYEGNKLIASAVAVNEVWHSPTNGSGAIKVDTATTSGSTFAIATYLLN